MFSDVLKQLRKRHNMTQGDLSTTLGITRSAISMYEMGTRMPDYDMMKRISDLFNVSMDYLYEREPAAEPSLSENRQKLIEWAKTVPEDKIDAVLQAMQSILAILQ